MSLTDESIKLESLEGCARCGCTHAGLRFFKLERPMRVSFRLPPDGDTHVTWMTHWALCPSRREPIMMQSSLLHVAGDTVTKGV